MPQHEDWFGLMRIEILRPTFILLVEHHTSQTLRRVKDRRNQFNYVSDKDRTGIGDRKYI